MKRSLAGMCVFFAFFGAILLSQNTASIVGTVVDPTGVAIANIKVEARSVATGVVYAAITNDVGNYTFASLPPGEYELKVSAQGFKTYSRGKLTVSASQILHLDIPLQVGSNTETVTVTAESTLLKTESGELHHDVQTPGYRDPLALTQLSPRIQNGQSVDAIQSVAVQTSNYAAEYGLTGGAIRAYGIRQPNSYPNTAQYDYLIENEFAATKSDPVSTFSVDVDTASYSNVRRFLTEGHLPPAGAVRIEELINYFTYDYPLPEAGKPVSLTTHLTSDPWNSGKQLLFVGLRTQPLSEEELPPSNLTFLIDVSGSMMPPERLPLIRQGLKMLVRQLRPQDRVALVVYAGNAGLVLPPTSGSQQAVILNAIEHLEAGGSTNGAAGIQLAYQVARNAYMHHGNNRVILATDGDFNVGVSSDDELVRMIEKERDTGIFLSVLGVGTDNLKDSRMEKLADHGNGNYAYLDSLSEARRVLVQQMGATLVTVAKDVKLQIEFNPTHVQSWRLIGYENRVLRREEFNDDKKDAGDLGAGHQVTAIYEIVPAGSQSDNVDRLRYQDEHANTRQSRSAELAWVKLRHKDPHSDTSELLEWPVNTTELPLRAAPPDVRFASAVAEYGMLLRQSKFSGNASFDHVLSTASGALGADLAGYRSEFLDLARQARDLSRSR